MKLSEIIAEVNKDIDDELDNVDIIGWVNRCIDELTPFANKETITTIPVSIGQTQYTLPSDLIKVATVVLNGDTLKQLPLGNTSNIGFQLINNNTKIVLQPTPVLNGSMDIYYQANLPYLVEMDDVPQIPPFFHDLFVLYAITKYMYQQDEYGRKRDALMDYNVRKSDFVRFMNPSVIEPIKDVYGQWQ